MMQLLQIHHIWVQWYGHKIIKFYKRVLPNAKADMSTVFMEKTISLARVDGYISMINIPVWMFLSSYEKLRKSIIKDNTIVNMVHPGRGIFGSDLEQRHLLSAKSVFQIIAAIIAVYLRDRVR